MKKKLNFEYKNAELVNIVIFLSGCLLTIFGIGSSIFNPDVEIILVSIGTSLIASSIIVYLSSRYLVRQSKIRDIIENWGLIGIYETRSVMNARTNETLELLENELDFICFGIRAFRYAKGEVIKKKVKKGLRIRILTMNPYSIFLAQREKDENEITGQIKQTILELEKWVAELRDVSIYKNQVSIKYYNTLPLESYYRQDNYIYIGPILYGKPSQQTIAYEFQGNSIGFNYWKSFFDLLWQNVEFAKNDYREFQDKSKM